MENWTSNYVTSNYPISSVLTCLFCQCNGKTDCTFQHDHCRDNKNLVRYTWSMHACMHTRIFGCLYEGHPRVWSIVFPVVDRVY